MSIFTALFGPKSTPPAPQSPADIYLAATLRDADASTSIAYLADYARDYSGYVREAALIRCVKLASPDLVPVVMGRLNDWVPEVRRMARSALMTLLPFMPADRLLATLPVIHRLLAASRTDHQEWVKNFEQNLIRTVDTQAIVDAARGNDVKLARTCFDILARYRLLDTDVLISMMETSRDIVLADRALQMCAGLPAETRRDHYLIAARSQFGAVRTDALRALLAHEGDAGKHEIAVAALLDVQSSVRAVAIHCLKLQRFDLGAFYRNALQHGALPARGVQVALTELASLRNAEDLALIESFATAPFPTIRVAALTAWLKVSESDKDAIASAALADRAPRVRKFALHAVRKQGAYIPFAAVRTMLEERGDLALLLQFSSHAKWTWLECIARIASQIAPDDILRSRLAWSLREWLMRAGSLFDAPDPAQIAFLASVPTVSILADLLDHDDGLIQLLELELARDR